MSMRESPVLRRTRSNPPGVGAWDSRLAATMSNPRSPNTNKAPKAEPFHSHGRCRSEQKAGTS